MNSVTGKLEKLGRTLMHEHLTIDLSANKNEDASLNDEEAIVEDLKEIRNAGIDTIVDVTNRGMGRDIRKMAILSKASNINVIASTGYYKTPYLPDEVRSKNYKELAGIMISEIREGIDGTGIKAGLIGEIGTSNIFTEEEEKVFMAACYAHNETGTPIYTHTTMGKLAIEQLQFLKRNGVNLSKVIIGHIDLNPDMDYYSRILDYGCFVGFDTIGKLSYQPDKLRAENILRLVDMGYRDRIVLSLDITRKSHLKRYGGYGHGYIMNTFIPMLLKNGLKQEDIDNMLIENPARIFLT
jgi:Phosphotriesterase family.